MKQEELKQLLPKLGFSYDRNEEFNRDEYVNKDYKSYNLHLYVDKNTTRCEILIDRTTHRKNYRTYAELEQENDIEMFLDEFIYYIKKTYNI